MSIKKFFTGVIGVFMLLQFYALGEIIKSKSGDGLIIYKVEMDADEVVQVLKASLEAQQITLVDTTNPTAPLSNNIKIFPDFDKLNVSYIQNFLITSITTLYKIFTVDPNGMVLSPWVVTIYQYEDDDYTYIVRTKSSTLLKNTKHPEVIKAVQEFEKRVDAAIEDLL
ncbi:hypothetical protein [Persephonella sp.]